ncbi:MAG: prolyl oligopeptidase family serine peptidase [Acidobacteria bacterium]|nr:prolyl oligopeptidase family serine peptidase [Acidobacteriota bacterium]
MGDISFNRPGDLLAYTVDATVKDGNGLFVFDTRSGRITTLDNDAQSYNRLTWSDDGAALAVLKGADVEKMRERSNVLVAYRQCRPPSVTPWGASDAGPRQGSGFPERLGCERSRPLAWSHDNKRVFFGIKEQVETADAATRRSTDDLANVDVWNSVDERIQSQQMIRAEVDRNFTFRTAFDVPAAKVIRLTDETMRELEVAQDGRWAVGRDTRGYIHDYKRPAADFYRVNTSTGERTLMFKNQLTGAHAFGISPDGRHFLYWKNNKFQGYELDAATTRTLGGSSAVSFVDMEFDHPGPKPSYGLAGYSERRQVSHRAASYDLWQFPLDGGAPKNITNGVGSKGEVRFRYARTEPIDPLAVGPRGTIDLGKTLTLSAYGEYTKKAGFYELTPDGSLKEVVFEDAAFSTPAKAAKADTFLFTRQTFTEFPDLRVSGPNFKDAKKITDINPQQAEYQWGRRVLFDYKNRDGVRLQGILALPRRLQDGREAANDRDVLREELAEHASHSAPSYLTGMGSMPIQAVSQGYITMLPDIHFRTGSSHSDMLECVEAAVKKVIEMGYADPKRIGVHGHSYGGEGAAFIGTRSKMFAAVGMGAGVTDLTSDFSQSWGWTYQVNGGSGANGNDYYIYGQGRWGVSPGTIPSSTASSRP